MKHFFTSRVRVVMVVAVLLAVLLAVAGNLLGKDIPGMVVKGVLTPLRTGMSKLVDQAERYYSYIFRYEALEAENEMLKEQLAQLEDNSRKLDSVQRENDTLRDLLELKKDHEDYAMVDAYIIARPSDDFTSTLTINRGQNAGIEVGMCAVTEHGAVVGLVIESSANYAVIKTVLDSSLEISATIAGSGYNGMVKGGYTSGQGELLHMEYLPSDSVIRNNDQVVTTGSTMYPRELLLGYVIDADFSNTGVAKYAVLEPAADIDTIKQVFIITEYNVG